MTRDPLVLLIAALVAAPLVILLLHVVIHRASRARGRPLTAHAGAIRAIAIAQVPLVLVVWQTRAGWSGASDWLSALLYELVVYAALAILYLDVVNIAETSLHVHIVLEVAWAKQLPVEVLTARYGGAHMVNARLERLISLGQIRFADGRYHLGDRKMLAVVRALDIWRRLLGLA